MPETVKSFDTNQGRFDLVKYDVTGARHMYAYDAEGNRHPSSHDKVMEAHHDPELEAKWNQEREEQARAAGEAALEGAKDQTENQEFKREVREGEAVWTDRKGEKHRVFVEGKSDKQPDGTAPNNGEIYVKVRFLDKDGGLDHVNFRRVMYEGDDEVALATEDLNAEGEAAQEKLDKIIPPTDKEKEREQARKDKEEQEKAEENMTPMERLEKKVEELKEQNEEQYARILKAMEVMMSGDYDKAAKILAGKENEPEGGVEEYRSQDASGHPVILRRDPSDNSWRISRNGDNPRNWEEVSEDQVKSFGVEPGVTKPDRVLSKDEVTGADEPDKKDEAAPEEDPAKQQKEKLAALALELQEAAPERQKEILAEMAELQAQISRLLETEPEAETQISQEQAEEAARNHQRSLWDRARQWLRHPIHGTMAYVQGRGAEDGPSEAEAAAAGAAAGAVAAEDGQGGGEVVVKDKTQETKEKRRRRGILVPVLGAVAVVGAGALAYYLLRNGHSPDIIPKFSHGHGGSGIGPNHLPAHHFDLESAHLNPNTIHAATPDQFHHGVVELLRSQGVPVHDLSHAQMEHMTNYMQGHDIASGMRDGAHGLEQNLTSFPHEGQEFANAHASAEQGFRLGADGTGREALRQYAEELQRIGAIA